MRRSKILYNGMNEAIGVVYMQTKGNLVGCGLFMKNKFQKRALNLEVANFYAQQEAFRVLWEHEKGVESYTTQGTVIDLRKSNYSFDELWRMSRVVVEGNDCYIMF